MNPIFQIVVGVVLLIQFCWLIYLSGNAPQKYVDHLWKHNHEQDARFTALLRYLKVSTKTTQSHYVCDKVEIVKTKPEPNSSEIIRCSNRY